LALRLDEILGPLTIHGGAGTDLLGIDDSGNGQPQAYQLTGSTLVRVGPPLIRIAFDRISGLLLHASENAGINGIAVSGTPTGVPVAIQTGAGAGDLEVSSLDQIQGPLDFSWSQGAKSLSVDDLTAAADATYQVLPDQIQRTGTATTRFHYGSDPLNSLFLAAGQAHEAEVDVPGTIDATPVNLVLGTAADTVVVGGSQENLDSIHGPLSIAGIGTATALLDDRGGPAGRTYWMDAGRLIFNSALPPITFNPGFPR
jgi:hypothetical protein